MAKHDAALLGISLDRDDPAPLNVQLSQVVRRLILTGAIGPGTRLPASRTLAQELSVSRATVTAAFDQLVSEGYAEGRHGSGVFVTSDLPERALQVEQVQAFDVPARDTLEPPSPVRPFQAAAPDLNEFPHAQWAKLFDRIWRDPEAALLANPDPLGWAPLRAAIAEHLSLWRGIECTPSQIVVTSGAGEATDLLARTIFPARSRILVEEPGYPLMRLALEYAGMTCLPVPVDEQGFNLNAGRPEQLDANGVVVTPSRHYPLGPTLPLSRRLELLEWAEASGSFIIEDDYDSEYRYQGQPLPALMSLDKLDRVVYIGSFSKVLFKELRIGFMVVPPAMIDALEMTLHALGTHASLMPQPVLARFMETGDFAAHIRRMRRLYARRQQTLLTAGADALDGLLELEPASAGMHLVANFHRKLARRMSDKEASQRADTAGLTARSLSAFYAGKALRQGLILGYAGFDDDALIDGVRRLAAALKE